MNNGITVVAFVMGAALGSFTTWRLIKRKYEQIAREEIDSVKEVFSRNNASDDVEKVDDESEVDIFTEDVDEYKSIVNNNKYNYSSETAKEGKRNMAAYVISPEEFGDNEDYEVESLTYYADGVLTDDQDNIIEDVEGLVGDALDHFGEFEDDSVFVRDDTVQRDYEILRDVRKFSDVVNPDILGDDA